MMKAISKVLALILAIAMIAAVTAACGDNGGSGGSGGGSDILSGSWKQTDATNGDWIWTFDGAGKCKLEGITTGFSGEGTYTLDESAKTVTAKIDAWDNEKVYDYTLEGDTLDLSSPSTGSSYHLIKQ